MRGYANDTMTIDTMNCRMVALSLFHQSTVAMPPNTNALFPNAIIVKSVMPRIEAYIATIIPKKMTIAWMLIRYEISKGVHPKRSAATGGSATWYLFGAREQYTYERDNKRWYIHKSPKQAYKLTV